MMQCKMETRGLLFFPVLFRRAVPSVMEASVVGRPGCLATLVNEVDEKRRM